MRNPEVPESLDGWHILHRMFCFDRRRFDKLDAQRRNEIVREATALLEPLASDASTDVGLAQVLGHKADVMLTHYAQDFEGLGFAQVAFDKIELAEFLEPTTSYVSILELGLYGDTAKFHETLRSRDLKPHSSDWNDAFDELLAEAAQSPHAAPRLWAKIPRRPYVCFYPMNKRRGEQLNWYRLPYVERAKLMVEIGRAHV